MRIYFACFVIKCNMPFNYFKFAWESKDSLLLSLKAARPDWIRNVNVWACLSAPGPHSVLNGQCWRPLGRAATSPKVLLFSVGVNIVSQRIRAARFVIMHLGLLLRLWIVQQEWESLWLAHFTLTQLFSLQCFRFWTQKQGALHFVMSPY